MYRDASGELLKELETGKCKQALQLAKILQTVRPDIVLVNEIDYDAENRPAVAFRDRFLGKAQGELPPLKYQHLFSAPVNTGLPSMLDLDGDRKTDGPADCWGFGKYPGQYGMAIYSRWPIDASSARTFQKYLWSSLPGALQPRNPETNEPVYGDDVWNALRLSSKSHWDVPVRTPMGIVHILASHPTPPVFDGPEDRNGCRNHDEIRFWTDYVTPHTQVPFTDDQGRRGPLEGEARFVILGDMNADPVDGTGRSEAIRGLLAHPRVHDPQPQSQGGKASSQILGKKNRSHRAPPSTDTAMFNAYSVGNLRIDYALPSVNMNVITSGVFWPQASQPGAEWIGVTDHRLVWVDLEIDKAE